MSFPAESTDFVMLSFEGPDVYSQAGGLGVRAKELTRALAEHGYVTHLYFVGDPDLPGEESRVEGRLRLHRWCQWLSAHHRSGVYDGEDSKVTDFDRSAPTDVIERVVGPAVAQGRKVVVLAEEWHTAHAVTVLSDALRHRHLRDQVVILWNANNVFGFHRIDWAALQATCTVTTVSRYMKHRMWESGVNPIVVPNGIPASIIVTPAAAATRAIRRAAEADLFCFKIGRFDPDKRWIMAVEAIGTLKRQGMRVKLLIRGGQEPHGAEVLARAQAEGLVVEHVRSPRDPAQLVALLREHPGADVLNLISFLPEALLGTIYAAADAVLANSGHEPFGLVGLEVMAAGGLAVTGSTGEDYASAYHNAIVLETDDSLELVEGLRLVASDPALHRRLRLRGRATAREYTWDRVLEQLIYRIQLAALWQGVAT